MRIVKEDLVRGRQKQNVEGTHNYMNPPTKEEKLHIRKRIDNREEQISKVTPVTNQSANENLNLLLISEKHSKSTEHTCHQ